MIKRSIYMVFNVIKIKRKIFSNLIKNYKNNNTQIDLIPSTSKN